MDRVTAYSGQLVRTQDFLQAQQNAMTALAKLTRAVFGTNTLVDGFTCTPTTPASLSVLLTAGSIYQLENLEATTWSALSADTSHSIMKQGILLDPVTFTITPPGTVGFSQVYLIEVQYADQDTGSTVLPYYNAANPTSPFSGPGNAGTAQNTARKGIVATQIKAGTAAATGSQIAPTADAGWTGLFTVTVANGQSTITSGNIATLSTAPFLTAHGQLPLVPTGVQSGDWVYATDTGTADALAVSYTPAITAYTAGMALYVKKINTGNVTSSPTINVNGLGAKGIVWADGTPLVANDMPASSLLHLVYDGTNFRIESTSPGQAVAANQNISLLATYPNAGTFTYTVPSNGYYIFQCNGAGGGGGYGGTTGYGSGGGGGAYAEGAFFLTAGQTVTVVVGAAGSGGTNTPTNGSDGGTTRITISGVNYDVAGGPGGFSSATTTAQSSGAAALPSWGRRRIRGGIGYIGRQTSSPNGGDGGSSPFGGNGGPGGFNASGGLAPGGGGGGSGNTGTPAAGADGQVQVWGRQ